MDNLAKYKDEIHKCSKCGLCQSVCPVYEQTGNDCAVSRGKFIMLNGVVKGDLELNANINKYLDMCLKCNACKDFCPSGIDAREIFLSAKNQYFAQSLKKSFSFKFIKKIHSQAVFDLVMRGVKLASTIYRAFSLNSLATFCYPILNKLGNLGRKIILANEFIQKTGIKKTYNNKFDASLDKQDRIKVVYFKGCVNEYANDSVQKALKFVLNSLNCEIIEPDFKCCGVPFLSSGNLEQFKKQAEYNLSQLPEEFDYFLTDCASCADAFVDYKKAFTEPSVLQKINKVLAKSINAADFISSQVEKISFSNPVKVTFHKPCHLKDDEFLPELFEKMENVQYIQMQDFDKCCGFAGEFAIKNQDLSQKISAQKAQNAIDTDADFILTTCPSCKLGIMQGLIEIGDLNTCSKVINLVEFIAMADCVKCSKVSQTSSVPSERQAMKIG